MKTFKFYVIDQEFNFFKLDIKANIHNTVAVVFYETAENFKAAEQKALETFYDMGYYEGVEGFKYPFTESLLIGSLQELKDPTLAKFKTYCPWNKNEEYHTGFLPNKPL